MLTYTLFALVTSYTLTLCVTSLKSVLPLYHQHQFEADIRDCYPGLLKGRHMAFKWLIKSARTCQYCQHRLPYREHLPILSYVFWGGNYKCCGGKRSLSQFFREVFAFYLFFTILNISSLTTIQTACALSVSVLILVALYSDIEYRMLPDEVTYFLLYLALFCGSAGIVETQLSDSVYGICIGYMSLLSIKVAYKLRTGIDGMGGGDPKLAAALGAWLGWEQTILMVIGAPVLAVGYIILARLTRLDNALPFGPFLIGAAFICYSLGLNLLTIVRFGS